ncbi:MAG: hypothetical protein ABJA67_12900 [Chthonomonadales bacterium]
MKTITLRDIPDTIAQRIEERSQKSGASLSRTVIDMLKEFEPDNKPKVYHDLDYLIGSCSKEADDEFQAILKEQKKIDPELWK